MADNLEQFDVKHTQLTEKTISTLDKNMSTYFLSNTETFIYKLQLVVTVKMTITTCRWWRQRQWHWWYNMKFSHDAYYVGRNLFCAFLHCNLNIWYIFIFAPCIL